jgi:hypothetical protein
VIFAIWYLSTLVLDRGTSYYLNMSNTTKHSYEARVAYHSHNTPCKVCGKTARAGVHRTWEEKGEESMKLKRIAAGLYETLDGKYEVRGFAREEKDGYGPAGEVMWYWRETAGGKATDRFWSKREAVEALKEWIEGQEKADVIVNRFAELLMAKDPEWTELDERVAKALREEHERSLLRQR